jgi:hypothetical protein
MKTIRLIFSALATLVIIAGCSREKSTTTKPENPDWKQFLNSQLPLLGHRNWILIVDKAFPAQTAAGLITVETNDDLLSVLNYTLNKIDSSDHVKPVVYNDKELSYIQKSQIGDIDTYRGNLNGIIGKYEPQVLLHDSVFVMIDKASSLFKVIVLKTNEVIPYSSVFIKLDCRYWNLEQEKELRLLMAK